MRRIMVMVVIVFLLLAGGALTVQIGQYNNRAESVVPFLLKQTSDPEASTFEAVPWQAEQLFWLVGFILFNLVGIALTIMGVMWFLNRGAARARAVTEQEKDMPERVGST
jgi:hypothetical protein